MRDRSRSEVSRVLLLYVYVNPQIDTNSIRKRGLPIWEYSTLPAHFRTGTPHMEMGSVFLATSKSRIEEYLPPNFGQEIIIFPLSRITLKALIVITIWKQGFAHPLEIIISIW